MFESKGVRVILTPIRTPTANASPERFVQTIRQESLNWILTTDHRHLHRIVAEYPDHDNAEQPHRRLDLEPPDPPPPLSDSPVKRRDRLGGLIHHYERIAA